MVWYILPTFVFFMWMCFKLHLRTIYCDISTVEETEHLTCARLNEATLQLYRKLHLKHTPKVDGTWLPIFSSYVFVNKVTFVYYMCVYRQ